jgi:CheY-like chemotaxis protein
MILSAAQHGADLTRQLLAFSRRQTLQPQAVSIPATLRAMAALLRRSLTSAIELEISAPDSLPDAYVDKTQLESAILNLCLNARDAMPKGGELRIEVVVTPRENPSAPPGAQLKPGDYLLLSVSDTGSGISAEHLPKVFDPFFTTKDVGKGTGLGLSIVYGFANQSGGYIHVESTPGAGTRFRLWLPQAEQRRARAAAFDDDGSEPVGGSETILLVEDDAMVRAYAMRLLAELGYRVVDATGARQALATLESGAGIDLLFTDIVMPGGMDGRQLGEAALALRPGLALLYTSGYSKYTGAETHVPGTPMLILEKPYGKRELARMIRTALRSAVPRA